MGGCVAVWISPRCLAQQQDIICKNPWSAQQQDIVLHSGKHSRSPREEAPWPSPSYPASLCNDWCVVWQATPQNMADQLHQTDHLSFLPQYSRGASVTPASHALHPSSFNSLSHLPIHMQPRVPNHVNKNCKY